MSLHVQLCSAQAKVRSPPATATQGHLGVSCGTRPVWWALGWQCHQSLHVQPTSTGQRGSWARPCFLGSHQGTMIIVALNLKTLYHEYPHYNIHRRLISKCPLVPECQTRSGTSIQWNTFRRYERILGWHLLQRGWTLETLCCANDDNHKRWYIVWFHFINYTEQSNAQMRKAKSWLPGIGGQEKWERTERIRSPW